MEIARRAGNMLANAAMDVTKTALAPSETGSEAGMP